MATRTPPKFVPTLTEVVKTPPAAVQAPAGSMFGMTEEQWVHRIMQRVDLTLDRRVREAIAMVVLEQTRTLMPMLRAELETAVRDAVADALAEEMEAASRRVSP
jgi:hypothetical protein